MVTVKISLNSIDKVKSFVNDLTKFDSDFDLIRYRRKVHFVYLFSGSFLAIRFKHS